MAAFVAILLLSNVIGAAKPAQLGGFTFGAGILFFPLSYLIGDVLTEVYGYGRARRCVWAGFAAVLFIAFMSWVVVALPPRDRLDVPSGVRAGVRPGSAHRPRLGGGVLGGRTRQRVVMARMKVATKGRHLWNRTIGSTVVGPAVDSAIFYPLAFLG